MDKVDFDIGSRACGFNFSNYELDLLVSLFELLNEKGNETTIMDISKIQSEINNSYEIKGFSAK